MGDWRGVVIWDVMGGGGEEGVSLRLWVNLEKLVITSSTKLLSVATLKQERTHPPSLAYTFVINIFLHITWDISVWDISIYRPPMTKLPIIHLGHRF